MGEDYESTMSHSLTVRASDGSTYVEAKADVMVQDANDAPMQSDAEVSDFLALAGQEQETTVDLKALFSDQDGDALSYSLSSNAPSWMSFVVVLEGAGDDQKVTGIISGTAPAGKDAEVLGVAVVATDGDGATGEAMFDVIVDAENSAPTKLEFMPTDTSDNTLITSATLDENSEGTELARVKVTDSDPAGHPHGQHVFSFMLGGELTTKFEVTDAGVLKLKDGESLDHEAYTGGEVTLRVTASDMAVDDPNGPADDSTVDSGSSPASTVESISRDFTLKITDTGDAPAAGTVGDWYVTVDEDLDAEDVRKGDWLAFGLQTEKAKDKDPAFTDPDDGDTLTYSLTTAPAWLQIDSSSGDMANKAGMLPENGVYDVTVTATDSTDKSASASFQIAVVIADPDGSDNDEPDIRGVRDYDYTEGSGVQKVAEFTVQDDDLPYSPHPYGKLTVELDAASKKLFDLSDPIPTDDPTEWKYEIHTIATADLAKGVKPLNYDTPNGDEFTITVTAKDGQGDTDTKEIDIDIDDAADEAPRFAGKKKYTVDQQESAKIVYVVQLSDAWSDADSDDDDLRFDVGGKGNLPSWIKVYGPDDWEDIYERQDDVPEDEDEAKKLGIDLKDLGDIRDRDQAIAIVIDRKSADAQGDVGSYTFTLSATDDDGNTARDLKTGKKTPTEITIEVMDTNVDITEDAKNPVVEIKGSPNGLGSLTIDFDAAQDPDLDSAADATLVLYTWSHDNGTPDVSTDDWKSTSVIPLPLSLDANRDGVNDYLDRNTSTAGNQAAKITATVEYYELNPENGQFELSKSYNDMTKKIAEPAAGEVPPPSASFDITTTDAGLNVSVTISNGDSTISTVTARLESSNDGSAGTWQRAGADTGGSLSYVGTTGSASINLAVDQNDDASDGDGGGLHYRVVLTYGTGKDQTTHTSSDTGPLGDVVAAGTTDIIGVDPNANPVDHAVVGETIRVNTGGDTAEVQWQVSNVRGGYDNIPGATNLGLNVIEAYAGKSLRAKVTYKDEDDATTPNVNETGWITRIGYTEVGTVPGGDNSDPSATQTETKEIEVELPEWTPATTTKPAVEPGKVQTGSTKELFHDSDSDSLTYSIAIPDSSVFGNVNGTGYTPTSLDTSAAGNEGSREEVVGGNMVYRTFETTSVEDPDNAGSFISEDADEPQQLLAIDKNTGELTYITNMSHGHDGNDGDGLGNVLTFTVSASDNVTGNDSAHVNVAVRINVAPTAIELQSASAEDTTYGIAGALPAPGAKVTGTALLVADGTNTPNDVDTDPDVLTFTDDKENSAMRVANIDVKDENSSSHKFGTHDVTLSGRGSDMFEVKESTDNDTDGSTWEIHLKDDATFDFEALRTAKEKTDKETSITLSITVTATDGGGLSTSGVFSVELVDAYTPDDPEQIRSRRSHRRRDPETPGLKDDDDDSDDDGAVPVPPPETEAPASFIDGIHLDIGSDLLDDFVIAIEDFDIA